MIAALRAGREALERTAASGAPHYGINTGFGSFSRERIEPAIPAKGVPFDNGLFRLICEYDDPERRAKEGPVSVTEPRISRLVEQMGPGRPIRLDELVDGRAPFEFGDHPQVDETLGDRATASSELGSEPG